MSNRLSLLAIVLLTLFAAQLRAEQPSYTTIQVEDMHCSECAKKIASKLYVIPGVYEVRADVAKNTAYVVPQKQKQPSAKAIWEAVEKAGFTPVKISGPTGVFVKKPTQ